MTTVALALVVGSYLLGAIPFGLVVTRLATHRDVREAGSGNIGATNVVRVAGKKWGAVTLVLDAAKGMLAVAAGAALADPPWLSAACGFAAFAGHCFPVYLNFRGGKGVATALGVMLVAAPGAAAASVAVFAVVFAAARVVSVASLAAALALTPATWFLTANAPATWLAVGIVTIVFARHTGNIKRLVRREEARL